jgi:hypothetical protein
MRRGGVAMVLLPISLLAAGCAGNPGPVAAAFRVDACRSAIPLPPTGEPLPRETRRAVAAVAAEARRMGAAEVSGAVDGPIAAEGERASRAATGGAAILREAGLAAAIGVAPLGVGQLGEGQPVLRLDVCDAAVMRRVERDGPVLPEARERFRVGGQVLAVPVGLTPPSAGWIAPRSQVMEGVPRLRMDWRGMGPVAPGPRDGPRDGPGDGPSDALVVDILGAAPGSWDPITPGAGWRAACDVPGGAAPGWQMRCDMVLEALPGLVLRVLLPAAAAETHETVLARLATRVEAFVER